MLVDWLPRGEQIVQITRACAWADALEPCKEYDSLTLKFKDCAQTCEEDKCNNDLSVGEKYLGDYRQDECYQCRYQEGEDGTVIGNKKCLEDDMPDERIFDCPDYLSAGCYTGSAVHTYYGARVDEVYKGCSAFIIEDGEEKTNTTLDNNGYGITRTTCQQPIDGKPCNKEHLQPIPPE